MAMPSVSSVEAAPSNSNTKRPQHNLRVGFCRASASFCVWLYGSTASTSVGFKLWRTHNKTRGTKLWRTTWCAKTSSWCSLETLGELWQGIIVHSKKVNSATARLTVVCWLW